MNLTDCDLFFNISDPNCTANEGILHLLPSWFKPLEKANKIFLTSILIYLMLAMGCTMELSEIIRHMRKPIPVAIGAICQFIFLPLTSFSLIKAFGLDPFSAIGCLIITCAPGGGTSNLFTYWLEGDVPLSIVMTSVSTVLAFGMMPLNIFIYSRGWLAAIRAAGGQSKSAFSTIPYKNLVITLASVVGPVIIGIFIRRHWPRIAKVLEKLGSVLGFLLILTTLIMQGFLYKWHMLATFPVWCVSILCPLVGFVGGLIISMLLKQGFMIGRTVGMETGNQNVALSMTVIVLSFDGLQPSDKSRIFLMPLLFGVVTLLEGFIFVGAYQLYKFVYNLLGNEKEKSLELEEKQKEASHTGYDKDKYKEIMKEKYTFLKNKEYFV